MSFDQKSELERLAQMVEKLQTTVQTQQAEIERLRDLLAQPANLNPQTVIGRRRLLKSIGGAVATAGLLGLTVNPARAADPQGDAALSGIGTNNRGVQGSSQNSDGVYGESVSGYGGVFKGGQAPLRLIPASTGGAPTTGIHQTGEIWLDKDGKIWVCTTAGTFGTTTPPKFASLAYDNNSGGIANGLALNLLPQPLRLIGFPLFEKLSGYTDTGYDPVTVNKAAKVFQVAGAKAGNNVPIPQGAKGVLGLAVVINPQTNGNLRVYATVAPDEPAPTAISIAYRAGQTLSHNVTTALSADGKMAVSSSSDCNFTFEVIGYYL
jgi:hypothetical protein